MAADGGADQGGSGFDATLRRLRQRAGLTQDELAAQAAIGVRTVRDLERGRALRPQRTTVELLAAARMLAGEDFKRYASIAKLNASNAAMENSRYATQVHGGYGFMNESAVGRFYRDAKILEVGEGTSEVQRMLIARSLGL